MKYWLAWTYQLNLSCKNINPTQLYNRSLNLLEVHEVENDVLLSEWLIYFLTHILHKTWKLTVAITFDIHCILKQEMMHGKSCICQLCIKYCMGMPLPTLWLTSLWHIVYAVCGYAVCGTCTLYFNNNFHGQKLQVAIEASVSKLGGKYYSMTR